MRTPHFNNTTDIHTEKVWGGPCDSHKCDGEAVAFININFTDGGSVGGYFCRHHLNQYEAAYGLPRTTQSLGVAA